MNFFKCHKQVGPTTIYVDSTSTKAIAEKVADTKKSKTIEVRYQYVHDLIKRGVITLRHVATTEMIADIFTKPLPRDTFEKFRQKLVGEAFSFMLSWVYYSA